MHVRRTLGILLGMGALVGTLSWTSPAYADATDLVPVRGEAAALGWHISYDAAARRVDMTKGDAQAAVWLDSRTGFRNAQRYRLTQPVGVWDGTAYMSQRDLDRVLGEATGQTSTAAIRQQIANATRAYAGIPYQWGGTSPFTGFDCSGFIWYLYRTYHIDLPRTTSGEMFKLGVPVDRNNLQPGDLVFFAIKQPGVVSHVGIYLGGDQFVSATTPYGIFATSLNKPYWVPIYLGARRI